VYFVAWYFCVLLVDGHLVFVLISKSFFFNDLSTIPIFYVQGCPGL
jgi:hypothetical protein